MTGGHVPVASLRLLCSGSAQGRMLAPLCSHCGTNSFPKLCLGNREKEVGCDKTLYKNISKAEEKEISGHPHTAHSKYIRALIACCNPTPAFVRETQLLDLGLREPLEGSSQHQSKEGYINKSSFKQFYYSWGFSVLNSDLECMLLEMH